MKKMLFMLILIVSMPYSIFAEKAENTLSLFPMAGYSYYPHMRNSNHHVDGGFEYGLGLDYAYLANCTIELTFNQNKMEYDTSPGDKNFNVDSYGLFGAYYWEFTEKIYLKAKLGMVVNRGSVKVPYHMENGAYVSGTGGNPYSPTPDSTPSVTPPVTTPNVPPIYSLSNDITSDDGYAYREKYSYDKTCMGGGLALDFEINENNSWGIEFTYLDTYIWDNSIYYRWTFM